MTIKKFSFNIYMTCILLSLLIAIIYAFYYLKKDKVDKRLLWLSTTMIIPFTLVGGLMLSYITSPVKDLSFLSLGFSSYGGAIGLIAAVLIYEKISEVKEIKYRYIISIPLIYSISKLGCFFAGCCYGIPYNGPLYVYYPNIIKVKLFPIQLLESIVFLIIFVIINIVYNKYKNKYIIEYTIIIGAIAKFLLDFLRYSHLNIILSVNQWISIILVIVTLIILLKQIYNQKNPK